MAKRQEYLKRICIEHYGVGMHRRMREDELLESEYYAGALKIYKNLGGVLSEIPVKAGPYDIDTREFIIELDEENHFNRYRLATLDSVIYQENKNLDVAKYKTFCRQYEANCCTHGGYWGNSSTQKMFGVSPVDGDFGIDAPSRWKQRAFYDYIKDVTSIVLDVPILRISIYDLYKGYTIDSLIKGSYKKALIGYINERLENLK